jgi:hypothetical protein
MFRKIVTGLTLVGFLWLQSCTSARLVPLEELRSKHGLNIHKISGVLTKDGRITRFAKPLPCITNETDTIRASWGEAGQVLIPIEDVNAIYLSEFSLGKTIGLVALIYIGVGIVGLIIVSLNPPHSLGGGESWGSR